MHLARVYWKASDPAAASRTWQCVMDEILKLKSGHTHERWVTAIKDKAFDSIRNLVVMETRPEHFLRALENGTVCTNIFLRRVQNFALDMSWLPWPVLPKKGWPKIQFKDIIPVEGKHGIGEPVFDGTDPKKALEKIGRALAELEASRRKHFLLKGTDLLDLSEAPHLLAARAITGAGKLHPVKGLLKKLGSKLTADIGSTKAAFLMAKLQEDVKAIVSQHPATKKKAAADDSNPPQTQTGLT